MRLSRTNLKSTALTGHVFKLVDSGEDRRITVLQVEDDQQGQSVIVEEGASTTGITCRSKFWWHKESSSDLGWYDEILQDIQLNYASSEEIMMLCKMKNKNKKQCSDK